MRTVSAREANQQFSEILEAAVGGEEVTITRRGVPVARLVPVSREDAEASWSASGESRRRWPDFAKGVAIRGAGALDARGDLSRAFDGRSHEMRVTLDTNLLVYALNDG